MRTLDHRGAAPPEVLSPGGTQPGDPRVVGATKRATFPQAGRIPVQSVSQPGETGSDPVTGRAALITTSLSEECPFRCGFHALRRVLLRQANDAETRAVAHLRVWLGVQDSFEQLDGVGTDAAR